MDKDNVVIDRCYEEIEQMQKLLGLVVRFMQDFPEMTMGEFLDIFSPATSVLFKEKGCAVCPRVCKFRGCDQTTSQTTEVGQC